MEHPQKSSFAPTEDRQLPDNTPSPAPAPHLAQVEIDDSTTIANYANFCRLSGTPEELLIDFGLNSQPTPLTPHAVAVSQRIVTGWHTAKRLLHVLQLTVERHESAFGVLETDVRKRIGRT
jgi:hypothetical protein